MGVWGAVGYPACCPCTALLQCIIRAELKMAAGIWFLFLYFVSLGSTAQSCCKRGCDMGLMTLVLGSLQSTTWVCSAQLEKEEKKFKTNLHVRAGCLAYPQGCWPRGWRQVAGEGALPRVLGTGALPSLPRGNHSIRSAYILAVGKGGMPGALPSLQL